MAKHTQTICRQFADELFECVWPFCGIGAWRVKVTNILVVRFEDFFVNHEWWPTKSNTVLYLSRKQIFGYCFIIKYIHLRSICLSLQPQNLFCCFFIFTFEFMFSASCNILIENRNSTHLIKQLPSRHFHWRCSGVFIANFEQVSYIVKVCFHCWLMVFRLFK